MNGTGIIGGMALVIALGLGVADAADQPAASLIRLNTRPGVTQSFILMRPERPVATAVLFVGGPGRVAIGRVRAGELLDRGNFLIRIRYELVRRSITVAIVDAPSDHQGSEGMQKYFRASAEHAQDIAAVIRHLEKISPAPIWLIGTSRGTESVAALATRGLSGIAGIVLTSSISMPTLQGPNMFELPLDRVTVPALVVAHKDDACRVTPPYKAPEIVDRLTGSPRKALVMMEGGRPAQSDPCEAMAAHGFFGVEVETVEAMLNFMLKP